MKLIYKGKRLQKGALLMEVHNFMEDCQYEFDDIKARIQIRLLKRDVNLNIMNVAPFIDAINDNLLIVFYISITVLEFI